MGDFAPGFSFDVGGVEEAQAPWEFAGALKQAEPSRGTTIDYKIKKAAAAASKQKNGKPGPNGRAAAAAAAKAAKKRQQESDDSDEEAVTDSEEEMEEEDDEPELELPSEIEEESEEEEEEAAAAESEEEEEEGLVEEEEEDSDDEEMEEDSEDDSDLENRYESKQGQAAAPKRARAIDEDVPAPAAAAKKQKQQKGKGEDDGFFGAAPEGTTFSAGGFAELNLSRPLLRACAALGYTRPTPIQAACIPLALTGRDICGSAITGSGKTAAFSLPLLERLLHRNRRVAATYVLVLTPTRELAVQVHSMIEKLAQFTDIRAALVVGGLSLQAQAAALRAAPEVVVATPGRLIDHLHNSQGFGLEDLAALVLDEADRLLEMGFAEEVKEIVRLSPSQRQTLLFSATMTEEVNALVSLSLRHPVRLAADAAAASPAALRQEIVRFKGAASMKKEATLLALASRSFAKSARCIVFFSTKQRAHRAKILFGLAKLPPAAELHGDMTQAARLEGLERFRKGEVAFLLATDVAARGLDILGVETVINFDCPKTLASYLHRVGRTARAGAKGLAVTFVADSDRGLIKEVVKKGGVALGQRVVPADAVAAWHGRVEGMEAAVRSVFAEEGEEKELRKAEMEAAKAANMIEHEAEIFSRPARTWFQSEARKREVAKAEKEARENGALPASVQKKVDKNTAKSARRMERKLATAKEEAERKKGRDALRDETAAVAPKVRAMKAREAALREEGVPAAKAGKIAAAIIAGASGSKKKKKAAAAKSKALFEDPEAAAVAKKKASVGGARVYAGGARSQVPRMPKELEKAGKGVLKRGGKGKGKFKSKAKHKRR